MSDRGVPRVLILGHSFVKRLYFDLSRRRLPRANLQFDLEGRVEVFFHGIGGRTVAKLVEHDLNVVRRICPHIVILEIGTNDLGQNIPTQTVGSAIDDLVHLLVGSLGVSIVCVCHVIPRCASSHNAASFALKARTLCQYLEVVLEPSMNVFCWRHRLFTDPRKDLYIDDVHLNLRGQTALYRSYCGAILKALKVIA